MEVNYLDLVGEGYMGSMQWQLGREMGTIPAFASRTQMGSFFLRILLKIQILIMEVTGINAVTFDTLKLYKGADVHILSLVISEIDVGERSISPSAALPPGKETLALIV